MPTIPRFDTPARLRDADEAFLDVWDATMNQAFEDNVEVAREEAGGKGQFYNPRVTPTDAPTATAVIRWKGFPLIIQSQFPNNRRQAWAAAERPAADGSRRQDEYLEWHVTRDANNKVTRVTFTTEGPEYWDELADHDRDVVLALYRRHVSPAVQMADLFPNGGGYDRLNRWNTRDGTMHLSHRANTLGAEINIAARATVRRSRDGVELTDAQELIECAEYGAKERASDPLIGSEVNALARQGYAITLKDPVGLYIAGAPNTAGWTTPDGTPAAAFWTVTRGTQDAIVRAVFEVPADKIYVVGDVKIGGAAIEFGGQIAEAIDVKLTGIACRKGSIAAESQPCLGGGPKPLAAADSARTRNTRISTR